LTDVETGAAAENPQTDDYVLHSEEVAKEAKVTSPSENAETPGKEDDSDDGESSEAPKKKGGFQRKLERANAEIELLRTNLAKLTPQEVKAPIDDTEPTEDKFENVLDYLKAHQKWEVAQGIKSFQDNQKQAVSEQAKQLEYQSKVSRVDEQLAEAPDAYPDYLGKVQEMIETGLVSAELEMAVLNCDESAKVSYYLATHPEDLFALQGLSEVAVNRAIAKLEAHLEGQGVAAVRTTRAAAPITPVKPNASTATKNPDEMSMEDYNAYRNKQDREKRGH
jgi:hypothetical protein